MKQQPCKPVKTKDERGYILLVSVMVSAVLTLMGFLVLHTVWFDSKTAYADRQSQSAFHLAEAGMAWGITKLNELDTDFVDFNDLLDEAPLDCGTGTDLCPCELTGWRPISGEDDEQIVYYPGPDAENSIGQYRVVVKDDNDGDDGDLESDTNTRIMIRSYGISHQGSRRMLEVTVTKSF